MLKGFKLLAVEPNKNIKDFNIFSFEKSDKLNRTIKIYNIYTELNSQTREIFLKCSS